MTQYDPHRPEGRVDETSGYYRRDVDEFYREQNVLDGDDPHGVTSDPPDNLRARRLIVFLTIVVMGLVAAGVAFGLMALPQCENPQYNWMPCIPDW